jgi:ATP-dependent exoDNAse (exonuclease V) beta subunit
MILDNQTDKVYLAKGLLSYRRFADSLLKAFRDEGIDFGWLPLTNSPEHIWARDYMPIQLEKDLFLQYTYSPDYLAGYPRYIPNCRGICDGMGLNCISTDIILDGGNVVRCGDKVIMTDKIFGENPRYGRAALADELESLFSAELVIIPWDRYEMFGHADGMVRHLGGNRVLLNNYADNERQIEAMEATEGHVRIVADAGSGKTRTLACRYAYLVNEIGVDPANILCLTFTNKAAQEMRQRISRLVFAGNVTNFVCTIHGFCVKFLREEIFSLGYPKTFLILDEEDLKAFAKEVFADNGIERSQNTVDDFLGAFGSWKFSHRDYIKDYLLPDRHLSEEHLKDTYVQMLLKQKKNFALDFSDLIYFTLYILDVFPDVRDNWQRRMEYVMVDEVQDCNSLDWEIFTTLSGYHNNLFIVGDPDQSIYEWRGACPDLFVSYQPDRNIVMVQNYRSTSKILEAANSVIVNNRMRLDKDLYTKNDAGETIVHIHGKDEKQEADWIAGRIAQMMASGMKASDFAVLWSSYLSRNIEQAFMRRSIPYVVWGGVRFFERKEIKDALSYLRLVAEGDDVSFARIVNVPSRKIGKEKMR